jgi:hypothetical protein
MKVKIVVIIGLTMSIQYNINKILQSVVTIKFLFQMTYNKNPISCIRQFMCE